MLWRSLWAQQDAEYITQGLTGVFLLCRSPRPSCAFSLRPQMYT